MWKVAFIEHAQEQSQAHTKIHPEKEGKTMNEVVTFFQNVALVSALAFMVILLFLEEDVSSRTPVTAYSIAALIVIFVASLVAMIFAGALAAI